MKLIHTLLLCLCASCAYSQTEHQNVTDGIYHFQKATVSVYNADTRAQVDTRIINDPVTLSNGSDTFFRNIFLEAGISNGILASCMLPDSINYAVKDAIELIPTLTDTSSKKTNDDEAVANYPIQLIPYLFSVTDNVLTFTVSYLYGDSKYSFPLEGKLTVILNKQK